MGFALPLADVATDSLGGLGLLWRGHLRWAVATFALTLAPAAAAAAVVVFAALSRRSLRQLGRAEAWYAASHLPCVQPFV